jgi:hypothetical protein
MLLQGLLETTIGLSDLASWKEQMQQYLKGNSKCILREHQHKYFRIEIQVQELTQKSQREWRAIATVEREW